MAQASKERLKQRSNRALSNQPLRDAVGFTTDRLRGRKLESTDVLGDWEEWRELGRAIRTHTVSHLDYYLGQFVENAEAAGSHVHFAADGAEAVKSVLDISRLAQARIFVKSKSMLSEEIHLNTALEEASIENIETDLGEYILQLAGETPSHLITPAIHKKRQQIADLFTKEGGKEIPTDTPSLAGFASRVLRQKFLDADIGLTGCNFAVADSGSVVLVCNEGNARLTSGVPKIHIVLMGMERVVPDWDSLAVMANLLPRSATGQKITSYLTVLTGPRGSDEADGPEEVHIIIVDNGRSGILGDEPFQEILNCIRCGACLNVCPVYRHIGGHSYGSIYPGPIGAVLTPLLHPNDPQAAELPYASSLCGACTEACPVKIPLHDMLVRLRQREVDSGKSSYAERASFAMFGAVASNAARFNAATKTLRVLQNHTVRDGSQAQFLMYAAPPAEGWGRERSLPQSDAPPFREQWARIAKELDGDEG